MVPKWHAKRHRSKSVRIFRFKLRAVWTAQRRHQRGLVQESCCGCISVKSLKKTLASFRTWVKEFFHRNFEVIQYKYTFHTLFEKFGCKGFGRIWLVRKEFNL